MIITFETAVVHIVAMYIVKFVLFELDALLLLMHRMMLQ